MPFHFNIIIVSFKINNFFYTYYKLYNFRIFNSIVEKFVPEFLYSSFWYIGYLGTAVGFIAAVAKSSLQYVPEGKAVLITGSDN